MNLNNVAEVGTKLPDVQSMEMQILEDESDASVQQKFNASTCSICNKDVTDKYISYGECYIQILYRCTFLTSYQLYYFVERKRKYTCTLSCLINGGGGFTSCLFTYFKFEDQY